MQTTYTQFVGDSLCPFIHNLSGAMDCNHGFRTWTSCQTRLFIL